MNNTLKKYLRNFSLILLLYVILQSLISFEVLTRYYSTILILVMVGIIAAVSLNLSTGMLGQLVLGHAAFMALGAYGAAITAILIKNSSAFESWTWNGPQELILFIVCAIFGGLVAALAGVMVGTPALRLKGDYLGIMTLGFGEVVLAFLSNATSVTGGAQGLIGIPRIMNFPIAFWTMVVSVTIIVLMMKSRHGRAVLSIRENEIAAEAVGINLTKYKVTTFSIAAFFGGIAGAVLAFTQGYIAPTPGSFGFLKSVDVFVMVVLGGMGSITGSIISASLLTFLPEVLREFAQYRLLIYSILLIAMMLFRPQGIFGTSELSVASAWKSIKSFPERVKKIFKKGEEE